MTPDRKSAGKKKRLYREHLNPDFGFWYTINKTLHKGKSPWQSIELVDTSEFGPVLLLDNVTQVASRGEYQYHEPMVHPALCAHPAPSRVLVIGGGDGGILREVLRYPAVREVHFAELDEAVVRFCARHLPDINAGAFGDPRVTTVFGDGRDYVEKHPGAFDVVIMDMTDPFGPSRMLYTREFFTLVKRSFRNRAGMFVMHSESPVVRPHAFACVHKTLGSRFAVTRTLYTYIQMYAALWSIAVSSDTVDIARTSAAAIDRRLAGAGITGLQLYTGATHKAMLTPYPWIEKLLASGGRVITDKNADFEDNLHTQCG